MKKQFPIAGIGASAGGLEAFTALLKHLPVDTGIAFVVVQHLAPTQDGMLPALLAKTTKMPVHEATQGMRVTPDCVYVIPPNTSMAIAKGRLKLLPRQLTQGQTRSIDFFFQALAEDRRHEAIGVILSGTASDGTLGLEAIKAEGGITFAQDESAKFDSMPRSAIAAGCVDFVLAPAGIAKEIARLAQHPNMAPPGEALREDAAAPEPGGDFKRILAMLRRIMATDFNAYKPATLQRRLHRRMVLGKFKELPAYAAFLGSHPAELEALGSDFLIGVTNFFRDPAAFTFLKRKIFPRLLKMRSDRLADEPLRIWVLGCSTGQEAYSIAMAWLEFAGTARTNLALQIFSTDVHNPYLDRARAGIYSRSLVQDVSPERLRRFFVEVDGGYRVSKTIREMCVFARQNILTDPPFSHLDMVSCRNMLIYLRPELQGKIVPTFHFALKPGGVLFLGPAETVSGFPQLFAPLDSKMKFFARKPAAAKAEPRLVSAASARTGPREFLPHSPAPAVAPGIEAQREADRLMLSQHGPVGVLINADLEVLQFRGSTGPYLEPASGKASLNLLKMAREGLFSPLRSAIRKALKDDEPVKVPGVFVKQGGRSVTVDLEVIPLKHRAAEQRCLLVNFVAVVGPAAGRAARSAAGPTKTRSKTDPQPEQAALQRELAEIKEHLQSVIEQQDAYNEELQSANEEAQASNEELQSINEEMETAKEELQASNEELTTVNEELHTRNDQLAVTNNDLGNLTTSVNLPVVMLDRDLRIRRFTTQAAATLRLVATDVGRAITDVSLDFPIPDLGLTLARVIDTVTAHEQEVQDRQGRWFALRMRPYMTADNKIDGAVMLLVDVDELKRTQARIVEARDYAEHVIETVGDALLVLNEALIVEHANHAYYDLFRVSPQETEKRSVYALGNGHWDIPELRTLLEEVLPQQREIRDFEVGKTFPRIGEKILRLNARQVRQPAERRDLILLSIDDVTERRRAEQAVQVSETRYRRLFEAARDGVLMVDPTTRKIVDANPFMTELLGYPREELLGRELFEIGLLKDREASQAAFRELQEKGRIRYENLPLQTRTGQRRDVEIVANLYRENGHEIIQCNIRDITGRRQAEEVAARLAAIVASSADAIISKDLDGIITSWNAGAERLFGYAAREAIGQSISFLIPPDRAGEEPVIIERIKRGERLEHYETVRVRKDGSPVNIALTISPIKDAHGRVVGASKIARDITEWKRAEEAVRANEEFMRSVLESSPDCVKVIDCDGRILRMNVNGECLMEIDDLALVVGHYWWDLWPEERRAEVRAALETARGGGTGRFQGFCPTAKGTPKWWDVVVAPIRGTKGEVYRFVAVSRDVTVRYRIEEALRENEQRLRFMAETMPQKIFTARPSGQVDYFNAQWMEFTGLTLEQMRDWGWTQFIHPDDLEENVRVWQRSIDTGEPFQFEHRFRRNDGAYRWHLSRARPMRDAEGRIVMWVGSSTEIDDQKRAEETLEAAVADRTAALKAIIGELETFSYTMAHDLRGPLRTMQGYANILKEDYAGMLDEAGNRFVGKITSAAQRMHVLVSDVLNFNRLTREALPLEAVALDALVAIVIEQYPSLNSGHIRMAGKLPTVLANPAALTQAISNLLGNAVKFVPTERRPEIEIRAESDQEWVTVSVRDNGIGIAREDQARIFRMFERAAGTEKYEGTGMGLAIVQRTVERMGGTVGVESEPGKGSTFWLRLRQAGSQEDNPRPLRE